MATEPRHQPNSSTHAGASSGRWRWWYSAISDWLLANPGGTYKACAAALGRGESTICSIAGSDVFKRYHSIRKQEFQSAQDELLGSKLHGLAVASIDAMTSIVTKRGDQVPMQVLAPVLHGALDRLGFAPKSSPSVAVTLNQQNNDNRSVQLPAAVSALDLEEARMALRMAERRRLSSPPPDLSIGAEEGSSGAEPVEAALVGTSTDVTLEVETRAPPDSD